MRGLPERGGAWTRPPAAERAGIAPPAPVGDRRSVIGGGLRPLVAALVLLTGCGPGDDRAVLTVYSPHGREMLEAFEGRYEAENPDIDVQWIDMGSQEVLERVRSEAANPQADVWWGGPSQIFQTAAEAGHVAAYDPVWADAVPPAHTDPEGRWRGLYVTPLVIAYNSAVLSAEEAPSDWDEVLDPRWDDQVLIRDPLASGTMRSIFGMIIQRSIRETGDEEAGFDWLRRLDAQTKEYVLNPTLLYQKLGRQEGLVTLWDAPDIDILRAGSDFPLDYVYAESGTPLVIDAIALVAGAPSPELGRRFIDWIGSREQVLYAAREYHRLPAREDLPPDSLPPSLARAREAIVPEPMDWSLLQQKAPEWMRRWDEQVRGQGR